jgi:hypothetical protein
VVAGAFSGNRVPGTYLQNQNRYRTWRCYVNRVANLYGVDERIGAQRVLPRANRSLASVQQISIDIIGQGRRFDDVVESYLHGLSSQ